jgi:hypothetical protein
VLDAFLDGEGIGRGLNEADVLGQRQGGRADALVVGLDSGRRRRQA